MSSSSAFLYEPRAAFYTEKGLKSKTKMRVLPAPSGKFASSNFN
jgi:hypothetical protein